MSLIPADHLRSLRNDVPVLDVITQLQMPTKMRGSRLSFRCPECGRFHTGINYRINLARCFSCAKSLNPIDIVMSECGCSFREAVKSLEKALSLSHTPGSCGPRFFIRQSAARDREKLTDPRLTSRRKMR